LKSAAFAPLLPLSPHLLNQYLNARLKITQYNDFHPHQGGYSGSNYIGGVIYGTLKTHILHIMRWRSQQHTPKNPTISSNTKPISSNTFSNRNFALWGHPNQTTILA